MTESIKNPKVLLQKLKEEKSHINELIEQGDTEKAEKIQKDIAWKKAFDRSEGKKVRVCHRVKYKKIRNFYFDIREFYSIFAIILLRIG